MKVDNGLRNDDVNRGRTLVRTSLINHPAAATASYGRDGAEGGPPNASPAHMGRRDASNAQ
jgi:hypothetical protein